MHLTASWRGRCPSILQMAGQGLTTPALVGNRHRACYCCVCHTTAQPWPRNIRGPGGLVAAYAYPEGPTEHSWGLSTFLVELEGFSEGLSLE